MSRNRTKAETTIRISQILHEMLKEAARKNDTTLTYEIERRLVHSLDDEVWVRMMQKQPPRVMPR